MPLAQPTLQGIRLMMDALCLPRCGTRTALAGGGESWTCLMCTLANMDSASACVGCRASREGAMSRGGTLMGRGAPRPGLLQSLTLGRDVTLRSASKSVQTDQMLRHVNRYSAATGELFIDPSFPPGLKTLYINGEHPARSSAPGP